MDLYALKREFLEYCELDKGQSVLTISNYDRYLSKFLEWLGGYKSASLQASKPVSQSAQITPRVEETHTPGGSPQGDYSLRPTSYALQPMDITQEAVREYRLYVNRLKDSKNRELKTNTQNYHMISVRAFLRYLAFRGINSLSPEKITIGRTGDREIIFLESLELKKMLSAPDTSELAGLRDRAILELLFSTGLRVSELASLDVDDLNFERGEIAVLGKGKKMRVVFISNEAFYWLDQYLKNRGYEKKNDGSLTSEKNIPVFISQKHTRLTVRSIERIVHKYSVKVGISKKVSPHTLRHSFATDLLISGADIRSVQSLLGHSSITTTQVYTHVTDQHLHEIHDKFHGKSIEEEKVELEKKFEDDKEDLE